MPGGATAAYRGYRLQALYTLQRVLSAKSDDNEVFQPEGHEDLAIYRGDTLVEVCQVKNHHEPLRVSTLNPSSSDSFFYRTSALLDRHPALQLRLASFGPIGPELDAACQLDGPERKQVADKISRYGFITREQAKKVLDTLTCVSVEEASLMNDVMTRLRDSAVAADPMAAFDLLSHWLYQCAEKRRRITRREVLSRIEEVGRFVAERAAHHDEWFTSIIPIEVRELSDSQRARLVDEFRSGISTRYEHVLSNADVVRKDKINHICRCFEETQVVVIHGASGQGKSTLAYRFLHDMFPNLCRYEVRTVESASHALRIAAALSGYARALDVPMIVYIDVHPGETHWPELVRQLANNPNLKILVTVREEDWRRASLRTHEVDFRAMALSFDQDEARSIYYSLVEQFSPPHIISFEDAWRRFGDGGPLLEFAYLITQGTSLRSRLEQQIERLRDEVRIGRLESSELHLLRLVSVANAYGARLLLRPLCNHLQLKEPQRTLRLLEEEYLITRSKDSVFVEGLHPIRSRLLAELLTDSTFFPWEDAAAECLELCDEASVEQFLLYAFVEHPHCKSVLLTRMRTLRPASWTGVGGIARALLWVGLKEYADRNSALIRETHARYGTGWSVVLDADVADANSDLGESLLNLARQISGNQAAQDWQELRSRQTNKREVFHYLSEWLSTVEAPPNSPSSDSDWAGVADAAFWIHRLALDGGLVEALNLIDLTQFPQSGEVTLGAELVSTLIHFDNPTLPTFRERLITRFRQENLIPHIDQTDEAVKAHFIVPFEPKESGMVDNTSILVHDELDVTLAEPDSSNTHDETIRRIHLMRQIWPECQRYDTQGYGHQFTGLWTEVLHIPDETHKEIPTSNLPEPRLADLNALFRGIVQLSFRPADWPSYSREIIKARREVMDFVEALASLIARHFSGRRALGFDDMNALPMASVRSPKKEFLLPLVAVDLWGYSIEDRNTTFSHVTRQLHDLPQYTLALEQYRAWLKGFKDYVRSVENLVQATEVLVIPQSLIGRAKSAHELRNARKVLKAVSDCDLRPLTMWHLSEAYMALSCMQTEFRKLLAVYIDGGELSALEQRECSSWEQLVHLWSLFVSKPQKRLKNPVAVSQRELRVHRERFLDQLRKRGKELVLNGYRLEVLERRVAWQHKPALWLAIDSETPADTLEAVEKTLLLLYEICSKQDDKSQWIYRTQWANVIVVPLVRGKTLLRNCFSIPLITLQSVVRSQERPFIPVPYVLPESVFDCLGISSHRIPELPEATEFLMGFQNLWETLAHINDLSAMPGEVDELGSQIMQQYLHRLTAQAASPALQRVLDGLKNLADRWDALSNDKQSQSPFLRCAIEGGVGLVDALGFDDHPRGTCEIRMELGQVEEWVNKLSEAFPIAMAVYMSWVAHLMGQRIEELLFGRSGMCCQV